MLFASLHQARPVSGHRDARRKRGTGAGEGYTINMPVPAGSEERLWLALLDNVVLPAAAAFQPQLVLVSAGFDAHAQDPLADCSLRTESFAQMALRALRARPRGGGAARRGDGGRLQHAACWRECVCATLPALAGEGERIAEGEGLGRAGAGDDRAGERPQVARHWPL